MNGLIPITVPMELAVDNVTIQMGITATECTFQTEIGVAYSMVDNPDYEGEYEVVPRLYQQGLETRDKVMRDDVTVYEIPVAYTSNVYGGKTVVIG